MSDNRCSTCGLLTTACRCSQLDRCGDCNGLIIEGFCDCDDDDEDDEGDYCDCPLCRDEEDEDDTDDCDCDCDCCLDICVDPECGNCMP